MAGIEPLPLGLWSSTDWGNTRIGPSACFFDHSDESSGYMKHIFLALNFWCWTVCRWSNQLMSAEVWQTRGQAGTYADVCKRGKQVLHSVCWSIIEHERERVESINKHLFLYRLSLKYGQWKFPFWQKCVRVRLRGVGRGIVLFSFCVSVRCDVCRVE
jgi:hypothetical protein